VDDLSPRVTSLFGLGDFCDTSGENVAGEPMTRKQFEMSIKRLGYRPHNAHLLLGIARSTVFRIIAGQTKVPPVVEKLLAMYELYGVPEEK
jgi:hypothetical protein